MYSQESQIYSIPPPLNTQSGFAQLAFKSKGFFCLFTVRQRKRKRERVFQFVINLASNPCLAEFFSTLLTSSTRVQSHQENLKFAEFRKEASHLLSQVILIGLPRVHENPGKKEQDLSSQHGLQPGAVQKLSLRLAGELEKGQPFMQMAGRS